MARVYANANTALDLERDQILRQEAILFSAGSRGESYALGSYALAGGSTLSTELRGVGFAYDGTGHLTGGTIVDARTLLAGGGVAFLADQISVPASALGTATNATILSDADLIVGSSLADRLFGYGGNDIIVGGAGDDRGYGDAGNDVLSGNAGDDFLVGGAGADTLYGDDGNDIYVVDVVPGLPLEFLDTINFNPIEDTLRLNIPDAANNTLRLDVSL